MSLVYNKHNFHSHTFCIWKEIEPTATLLQQKDFQSKSGSRYIFTDQGVYRISNHWGRAANCRWRLEPLKNYKNQHLKIGYAHWNDFYPNDATSRLFYIKVELDTFRVDFYHKSDKAYDGKALLRNASDTMKTIKIIRQVLLETAWAKHLQYDNWKQLQQEIIHELIYTGQSFLAIKQKYHH